MACNGKLEKGEITESDVNVSRIVSESSKTFRPLKEVMIKKVLENERMTVIICGSGDRQKFVGKEGIIINKLSRKLGKPIRIVEETGDIRKFLQNLIHPVRLLGMNVVYSVEGEIIKVIIPKNRNIPLSEASFRDVVRLVFGKSVMIARA
jgi:transcription antitermination factor NusA-like protein